jgi:hypothetical protein
MTMSAKEVSRRLAAQAEAVCRRYLSSGRREGRYWLVGDIRNTPGRSLYVRLVASPDGRGAPGKWTDSATGEHGDLLDIIARAEGHSRLRDTLDEARHFLSLPSEERVEDQRRRLELRRVSRGGAEAARRLLAASKPIEATMAQRYLHGRALLDLPDCEVLRFHPRCYYRPSSDDAQGTRTAWPAMIAAVTDLTGAVSGAHRTWLDPTTLDKAPLASPRRAMGLLLGHRVRFGAAGAVMAAGEGIETILSLRQIMPSLPTIAALSAAHLAAIEFPTCLRRLYVALDADPAGDAAHSVLAERAVCAGIELLPLRPLQGDFNDDLRRIGRERMRGGVGGQLAEADRTRFLLP